MSITKQPEWLNNAVFYEIYPQSFNDTTHRLPTQLPEGKLHREPAQAPVPANKTQFSHISFLTKTHRHVGQRKRCPHLPKKTGAFLPGIESWARRILVTSEIGRAHV